MNDGLPTELVQRAKAGDRSALDELVRRYQDEILRDVRSSLGDELRGSLESGDIRQEVLMQITVSIGSFKGNTDREFVSWAHAMVQHKIADQARKRRADKRDARREDPLPNQHSSESGNPPSLSGSAPTPSQEAMRSEKITRVRQALAKLEKHSADYACLIRARLIDERSWPEIGDEMGETPDAVRTRFVRASEAFKPIYMELDPDATT